MAISFHPQQGALLICDFEGMKAPEMIKRRPAIVVSPRSRERGGLCTVVPLSTTAPRQVMPYHYRLIMQEPLPAPYDAEMHWVKADMLYTVSLVRLFRFFAGKNAAGERIHVERILSDPELQNVQRCILQGLGILPLTVQR